MFVIINKYLNILNKIKIKERFENELLKSRKCIDIMRHILKN